MLCRLGAGELQAPWRFDDALLLHGSRIFIPDQGAAPPGSPPGALSWT
jgi:hypothetical protein